MINVTVIGAAELEKKLMSFEPKLARKVIRKALREAAKPVLAAAKANVPVDEGDLKKSLKVKALKKRKKGTYTIQVATSDGWFKGDQFYGAFLEFGTSKMAARPFIRPAYDSQEGVAGKIIMQHLRKGIEQIGAEK